MMSQEDYNVMNALESVGSDRENLLLQQRPLVAKTFISLLSHVSKDQTIQYILVLLDDMISVSFIFIMYSGRTKDSYVIYL